jgi:hypothetical protein
MAVYRFVDAERSYRATLLGLRHGVDVARLLREVIVSRRTTTHSGSATSSSSVAHGCWVVPRSGCAGSYPGTGRKEAVDQAAARLS